MSANDFRSADSVSGSEEDRSRDHGDGLIERMLVRLGLKAPPSIRDDLEDALEENDSAGEFSPHERAMLRNVLGLRQKRVDDVMVPRADIVAVSIEIALGDLMREFRTAGHSRLPVYAETLDDPRGMVHIRDFLDHIAGRAETASATRRKKTGEAGQPDLGKVDLTMPLSAAKILRPVLFVPPSMPALDLLLKMQTTRTHMALVIDEYGGTDGLVSIEDLIETVVGDIEDEHDDATTPAIVIASDGRIIADGRASLEEVSGAVGIDLAEGEPAEDVDTLGGLIATMAGRVPSRGEIITGPGGLEFEVLDADPRRIKRLRIHRRLPDDQPTLKQAADARVEDAAAAPAAPASEPRRDGDTPPSRATG
jgi:CBS domain containing-hemolysin-like protein